MAEALVIAVVGAESTGKTALARDLSLALGRRHGLRSTWVPELLRQWCDERGRTPRRDEQAAIAAGQTAAIEQAARTHELVVCDTTAVMTAVYSLEVFGDASLHASAAAQHRRCDLTLLTALDLPWVADGLQRDGPQVREPVDALLRELLAAHSLPWSLVAGTGSARLDGAIKACEPLLQSALRG